MKRWRVLLCVMVLLFFFGSSPSLALVPGQWKACSLKEVGAGKFVMQLKGSPYERGYGMGYLAPEAVSRLCSLEYYKGVIEYIVKTHVDEEGKLTPLFEEVKNGFRSSVTRHKAKLSSEMLEEMQGVADGVTDRGYELSLEDVVLLNVGVDALLTVAYPLVVPLLPALASAPTACNAFVATKGFSANGHTYMGRDFMFSGKVFSEYAMLIEQHVGDGRSFVSVAPPGFVGVMTGMNSSGIGIGVDMITAMDVEPFIGSIGCLLTCRKVLENAATLDEAIEVIRTTRRSAPWIYAIGDGRGDGAMVEASARYFKVRGRTWKLPWYLGWLTIPKQKEADDELVVATNHFMVPKTAIWTLPYVKDTSLWRYDMLLGLLEGAKGELNAERGREIIDFLHPPHPYRKEKDPCQSVKASVTLFDLTEKRVWSLFGRYCDPWVSYQLSP
ncbi:MAG: C45 family autoproteolytic acyltransferase/hydrolase [Desulfobacterales bacterium]|nr:C45 family autoproteolytic acyltransferase/hydrolase [Desulfobacterales bacterium]